MIQEAVCERASYCPSVERTRFGFSNFAAVPSNFGAVEVGARFAQGTTPLVIVMGTPGWGKTHLIESVKRFIERQSGSVDGVISAIHFAEGRARAEVALPILIDDAQDIWGNMRAKQQFRRLIERRVKSRRPTFVCCADTVSRLEVARFVPCAQDWAFQSIVTPSKRERAHIVRQIADTEHVALSHPLVTLFARHLCGDGRSIRGAMRTLKVVRNDWSQRSDVIEACGVLNSYIQGEDGWDPRDAVWEIVQAKSVGHDLPELFAESVCSYLLVSQMGLSEYDVATFLGVSPQTAYAMSVTIKEATTELSVKRFVVSCKDAFVRSFDADSY